MRVAYGKIGRTQAYDPVRWGVAGGDWEAPILLNRLARMYPEVEWVIVGHTDGADPSRVGLPSNVVSPAGDPSFLRDLRRREQVINTPGTPDPAQSQRYIEYMLDAWGPTLSTCDHIVLWMGQNDTINQPIPKVDGTPGLGSSRQIYIRCVSYLNAWINRWRDESPLEREPIWLCSDIWNMLKARDLRWPQRRAVVGQYNFERDMVSYRYKDPRDPEELGFGDFAHWHGKHPGCWQWKQRYEYTGLELASCVPDSLFQFNDSWEGRRRFGVMINQSRAISGRDEVLREWIRPMWPDWIVGSWDEQRAPDIKPYPYHALPQLLTTVRSSFAVPIKLSHSWATPKAWEMFALGVVCFMHPKYDTQGHILPTLDQLDPKVDGDVISTLTQWLRVTSPTQLRKRIDHLNTHWEDWEWIVKAQRAVYNYARRENRCLRVIGTHLGIQDAVSRVA